MALILSLTLFHFQEALARSVRRGNRSTTEWHKAAKRQTHQDSTHSLLPVQTEHTAH